MIAKEKILSQLDIPEETREILTNAPGLTFATTAEELAELSCPSQGGWLEVTYDIPGKGSVVEAKVCKAKNGVAINYLEPYMRRRDPDCTFVGDNYPTDKPRFKDRFKSDFSDVRKETLAWLKGQKLAAFAFIAGKPGAGYEALAIVPENAAFFALCLALLQGIRFLPVNETFKPKCILYTAPTFRHTHFNGRQVVVHNRTETLHEVWSYNLYPGPSAKKGIYGALINLGEKEGWVTAHASAVQVVTPYDNRIAIMHEGASGGGKSEMLEHVHRENDGTLLFGTNVITAEKRFVTLPKTCELKPVADDMALCHPSIQKKDGKLHILDAESAWFIRVNHITNYGTDPDIEARSIHPTKPLVFLNIDAQPGSTALLWEHIEDAPGKVCPNPRFILPREIVPDVLNRDVGIDVRSFGVRTPPCTKENPSYGILGLFHVLPPALAWIWRLVSPRGYDNPSIVDSDAMSAEGVGSYWPFATGKKVDQANLLLQQMIENTKVRYTLCPNQHIGAWKVNFMPQWIMREYLARRGGVWFTRDQIAPARCSLLGYALNHLVVEGQKVGTRFLKPETQVEIGNDAYDKGARMLEDFFKSELRSFLEPSLHPVGRKIIECCLNNGSVEEYASLIEAESLIVEQ